MKTKAVLIFLAILGLGSQSFGLESNFKPSLPTSSESLKLEPFKSETKAARIIRDSGIGLGVGAFAGLSFILLSQGRLPQTSSRFDNETLVTSLLAGVLGGAITGVWETKHDPAFQNSEKLP